MILFLSKYPVLDEEFRDGFYQRVENIDNFFHDDVLVGRVAYRIGYVCAGLLGWRRFSGGLDQQGRALFAAGGGQAGVGETLEQRAQGL